MKTSILLTLSFAAAIACGSMVVGCSDPDVSPLSTGADATSGDDDDTSTKKKKTTTSGDDDDDDDTSLSVPTTTPATTTTTPATSTTTTTTTSSSSSSSGSTTTTGQACFTHCVSTESAAAALDACSNKCADGDENCLAGCYNTSGCGVDANCQAALDQCDSKCFTSH